MTKETLECSFCGKQKSDTNLLIAGLGAHICDLCMNKPTALFWKNLSTKIKMRILI